MAYDPRNLEAHVGVRYITVNGSMYRIQQGGFLECENAHNGAVIEMIAAIPRDQKSVFSIGLTSYRQATTGLDFLLKSGIARAPEAGLCLALVLNEDSSKLYGTHGIVTSRLDQVIGPTVVVQEPIIPPLSRS
jgi:hypothetical protein